MKKAFIQPILNEVAGRQFDAEYNGLRVSHCNY